MSQFPKEVRTLARALRLLLIKAAYSPSCRCDSCYDLRTVAEALEPVELALSRQTHAQAQKELNHDT